LNPPAPPGNNPSTAVDVWGLGNGMLGCSSRVVGVSAAPVEEAAWPHKGDPGCERVRGAPLGPNPSCWLSAAPLLRVGLKQPGKPGGWPTPAMVLAPTETVAARLGSRSAPAGCEWRLSEIPGGIGVLETRLPLVLPLLMLSRSRLDPGSAPSPLSGPWEPSSNTLPLPPAGLLRGCKGDAAAPRGVGVVRELRVSKEGKGCCCKAVGWGPPRCHHLHTEEQSRGASCWGCAL
jgi:hypothetical protein